jgi:hypothetical protein
MFLTLISVQLSSSFTFLVTPLYRFPCFWLVYLLHFANRLLKGFIVYASDSPVWRSWHQRSTSGWTRITASSQDWANMVIATSAQTSWSAILLPFSVKTISWLDLTGDDILVLGGLWYTSRVELRHHSDHWRYQGHTTCAISYSVWPARHLVPYSLCSCNELDPFVGSEPPGKIAWSSPVKWLVECIAYWGVCGRCRCYFSYVHCILGWSLIKYIVLVTAKQKVHWAIGKASSCSTVHAFFKGKKR